MEVASVTILAFAVFSALRVVSYVPQIRKVARDQNGASAISYATWGLWTCANTATASYAAVNLQDIYLSTVSGLYAFCCVVVIGITMHKRKQFQPSRAARRAALERECDVAAQALKDTVDGAAVALAANVRPCIDFEQTLAMQARSALWCDLKSAAVGLLPTPNKQFEDPAARSPGSKSLAHRA